MRTQAKYGGMKGLVLWGLLLVLTGALFTASCSDDDDDDEVVVDLRADVNRNGTVDLCDSTEDVSEDTWGATQGAIFLANIDDDQKTCPDIGSDEELAACNDAADEVVNGESDLLDMAELRTVPYPNAADDACGKLNLSEPGIEYVRLFRKTGSSYAVYSAGEELSAADLRSGVEFRLEGKDFVRDNAIWDGYLDITFVVMTGGVEYNDKVRFRISPVIFHHHLNNIKTAYVTAFNFGASSAFRNDLKTALNAAAVEDPLYEFWEINDQWTQDFMDTAYMSMPAHDGQHVIQVNFRSPNYGNKLRQPGRVVFTELRGPDVAGAVQYDPTHPNNMDSLNSFGNLEVIPPFTHDGVSWPFGRVLQGSTETFYPDKSFRTMLESQQVQSPVSIDTEWLIVGHVDEAFSYVEVDSDRGWVLLANDPIMAIAMLQEQENDGYGDVVMFKGMTWMEGQSAEITISEVLSDPDLMDANAWAAIKVEEMITSYKTITGISDEEIEPVPFLHQEVYGYSLAFQPGTTNSIVISRDHFAAPATHGPEINGYDLFQTQLTVALAAYDISTHFVENWDLYHALWGEIHCGCAVTREIPTEDKWWESGL